MSIKKRKKKNAALKGQAIIGIGLVLVLVFGFYAFKAKQSVIERDGLSLCRLDGSVSRETALVIDATDSFSPTQAMLIKKEIKLLLEESMLDERISLYVLNENVDELNGRFTVCNPGDGSERSEWTSNKRRLYQKWEKLFYKRVIDSVNDLVGENQAKRSPILEMLKYVSVEAMYGSPALEKRIVVVSDMLQHTDQYSHYKIKPNYEGFSETPQAIELRPHLVDVEMDILYVIRPKDMKRQNRGHIRFWESYMASNGGVVSRVKSIN